MEQYKYKVTKLIDPGMCLSCRFAKMADTQYNDGTIKRSLHCLREWCDNHGEINHDQVPVTVTDRENYV